MPYIVFISMLLLGFVFLPIIGIIPRELAGLAGIPLAAFQHANTEHLWSNFIPLTLMGGWLYYKYKPSYIKIMCFLTIGSGAATWLIGEENRVIIGASALVCALFGFIIIRGVVAATLLETIVGFCILLMYGSLIIGGLVSYDELISTLAHRAGLITGVLFGGFMLVESKV